MNLLFACRVYEPGAGSERRPAPAANKRRGYLKG